MWADSWGSVGGHVVTEHYPLEFVKTWMLLISFTDDSVAAGYIIGADTLAKELWALQSALLTAGHVQRGKILIGQHVTGSYNRFTRLGVNDVPVQIDTKEESKKEAEKGKGDIKSKENRWKEKIIFYLIFVLFSALPTHHALCPQPQAHMTPDLLLTSLGLSLLLSASGLAGTGYDELNSRTSWKEKSLAAIVTTNPEINCRYFLPTASDAVTPDSSRLLLRWQVMGDLPDTAVA